MFQISHVYHGFKLLKVTDLPELKCKLQEFIHVKTGAPLLHIENDDPENVFCLSFQTLPKTSNGVAHILEHTVLCGSEKFPIKDPFFAMNRRSLNTFMNALTGSDFTCYPAATQVPKDFYNLLDVYLDAVFHPNLLEKSFKQEGHRIEFEDPIDPKTPLTYRGIVFNEMKGAMNSASSRMHEALFKALYPTLTYGVNSGGEPAHIPDLSYPELVEFHKTYYHPSRCLFFFYGNMPLDKHLSFLENTLLKHQESAPPLPQIPKEVRFTSPKHVEGHYPIASAETHQNQDLISFGWLTCDINEPELCLALGILEIVLLDTDASLLKKALLKSGLCKHVSSYIDTEISEVPFTISLKGCSAENADKLETLIKETLKEIVKEGLPLEAIENAIHQFEFHRSEISGDYYPFGLTLFMRSGLLKQHGGDALQGLLFHSLFDEVRRKAHENPHYFTELIEHYLLNNPHFVRVILKPDETLEQKEQREEKLRLETIKNTLQESDFAKIIQDAEDLKAFQKQQEEEDEEVLPKVTLEDIPKKARTFPLIKEHTSHLSIYHHDCFTNEIGYADLFFDLPPLSKEELIHLRLLAIVLHQVGAGKRGYEDTLHFIQANTGGITPYLTLNIQAEDHERILPSFALRGKALYRKLDQLFPLLHDFLAEPELTNKGRIKEIIHKHWINLESSLNQSGLKYAVNFSASNLNAPGYIASLWYGLDYYQMVRQLAHNLDEHIDELIYKLSSLASKVLCHDKADLVLAMGKDAYEQVKNDRFYGLEDLPKKPTAPWHFDIPLPEVTPQARIISSPVAFIAKVFNTVSFTHPDAPALNLAAFLLDNLTLHKKIREEGGAYGGGAVSNVLSGNFYFYSYRDPNIYSTLQAFEESVQNLVSGQFDEQDLEEAKFELIQGLDSPISPGSRADIAYSWLKEGKSQAIRQAFRDRLLSATLGDIIAAVQRHIVPQFALGKTIIFTGRELIEKENAILKAEGKAPFPIFTPNE